MAEESKWAALVEADGAEETKVIPTDDVETTLPDQGAEVSKWANLDPSGEYSTTDITYDDRVNLNVDDYRDELGGDIFLPDGENGIDILNKDRATNQAWYNQAGNFLGQAVVGEIIGGTLEGLGYILDIGSIIDVMQGDEADWGNFITEAGQGIREGTQEALQIHQDPTAQGWDKMADSGWWFSNSVSIASTLSMLIPTMGAMKAASFIGKGLGASKGMKAVRRAAGMAEEMGSKSKWMTNGLSQAVLSRNIENWMEAHGTYEDHKNTKLNEIDPATGENFTEEKAGKLAGEAASGNWKKGWAMLLQDIPQFLAIGKIFDPISKKMVNSLGAASKKGIISKLKPWQQKVGAIGGTFVGEGAEESYQYLIAEQSKYKSDLDAGYISQEDYDKKMSDAYGSEEMMTSAFFGGLGGNLFQATGSRLNEVFKSKDRKEYEKKLGEMYTDNINNKAKQVALMFQHLNNADDSGSKNLRETIINESMLNLTSDALEAGKFDQFYETIGLVSEMSEEDLKSFEETTGQEFSVDLAKEYAPKIQKKAIEMRDRYFKYRKRYSALTSSKLSRLEMENNSVADIVNEKNKVVENIKNNIGQDFDTNASDRLRIRLDIRERGQVLTKRKKELNNKLIAETSDVKKTFIKAAIENNELLIKKQKADAQQQKVDTKNRTAEQKKIDDQKIDNDKAAEKIYNKLHKQDILDALDIAAQGKEQIIINNEDMAFAKTSEGAKLQQAEKLRKQIASYDQIKDKAEAISALKEAKESLIPNADYITNAQKEEAIKSIDDKILEYENQIGEAKATKLAAETEARLKEKNKKNNEDPTVENNQIIKDIGDVIEDENFEANPDTTYAQIESAAEVDRSKAGDGKLLALLDKVNGTEAYQKWNENPTSKVDKEFRYTVSERTEMIDKEQNDAIEAFEKLPKDQEIPQIIYDNLPIRATLKDHPAIMTYLPHKPSDKTPLEDRVAYQKGYAAQRVIIIDKLRKGETVTSTVALNTGGELNVEEHDDDSMSVPENSVLDLLQIGNIISNVKLLITDKFGYLMDTNKETDTDLGYRQILLQNDIKGNKMPYRGGMFLKIKKANGDPFALRLNLLKNTEEQAQILAGLLIRLSVPTAQRDKEGVVIKNEKGTQVVKKEIEPDYKLSDLSEDFREDVERIMGTEIKMLDPKHQDPKIADLINSFVYFSKETENKTTALHFSDDNRLIFGNEGDAVTLINREDNDVFDKLVTFLTTKKRRQFSINLWNKSDEYKKYVLENKIVNTDVPTGKAMFTNQRKRWAGKMGGRRIQLYMNPVKVKSQAGVIKDSKGNETLSNQSEQEGLDEPHGSVIGLSSLKKSMGLPADKAVEQPTQQSNDDIVLSEDIVFNSAIGQQVAWDSSSKSWVKKIDESMSISEETSFKKDGVSYSYADWMPSDQQYQKQDLSTGKIVTKNITKKEYDEAKGSLDDNRFRVEEISFEEAKELYEYSKLAQQTSEVEGSINENLKKIINNVYPGWINSNNNQISLAAEFKSISLLAQEETPIKDRIAFGKEAENLLNEVKKGKNPFTEDTTVEEQIPNLLYAYISGELAKDNVSEKDMYKNILQQPTQQSSEVEIEEYLRREENDHNGNNLEILAKKEGVSVMKMAEAIKNTIERKESLELSNTPDFGSAVHSLKVESTDTYSARYLMDNIKKELAALNIKESPSVSDGNVRNASKKVVPSPKLATKEVVSQTFINFATEEEYEEEDFSDVEGDDVITTKDIASLDNGEIKTNCKKVKIK